MKIDSNTIIKIAAVITALGTIGYTGWAIGEETGFRPVLLKEFKMAMDQTEANTIAIAASKFERLEERLKRGDILSWEDKRDFCTNAFILDYPVSGSYGLACTKDGKPDLVNRVNP